MNRAQLGLMTAWTGAHDERYFTELRALDDSSSAALATAPSRNKQPAMQPPVKPRPAQHLDATLNATLAYCMRYVHFPSPHEPVAVSLWVAHAWAVDAADVTPYLAITSAEKRSGKSRLLDVLEQLVPRPWRAVTPSDAVVFRKIDADAPTLLLDEVDAVFTGKRDKEHEGLRAILNAGTRRGTTVPRVVGEGKRMTVQDFATFGPKALAAIGTVPDTISDRAIPVRLERRARSEAIERFRVREASEAAEPLREALEVAVGPVLDTLATARPELPDALGDRAQDAWEALLAIADAAGGSWPRRARTAAIALSGERQEDMDEASLPLLLLSDIRASFETAGTDRLTSAQLVESLVRDEERPWATYRRDDKPLTAHGMSRLLHRYGIRPGMHRFGEHVSRGYQRADFEAAWDRYLPPPETALNTSTRQPGPTVSTTVHAQNGAPVDGLTVWTPLGGGGEVPAT